MKYEVKRLNLEDKNIVYDMFKQYVHELNVFKSEESTVDINDIKYLKYLEKYLSDNDKLSFLFIVDDVPVGFAFVKECKSKAYSMEEFYILPKYRRKKIGISMSVIIFDMLKGKWKISVLLNNINACRYWKNVVNKYTNGNYKNEQDNDEKRYIFYFKN